MQASQAKEREHLRIIKALEASHCQAAEQLEGPRGPANSPGQRRFFFFGEAAHSRMDCLSSAQSKHTGPQCVLREELSVSKAVGIPNV